MAKKHPPSHFPLPDWEEYLDRNHVAAIESFTARQFAVLSWVAAGNSNREIAQILKTGIKTVDLEIGKILKQLEVKGRCEAGVIFTCWRTDNCSK